VPRGPAALYYSYLYSKAFSRRAWHRFFAADPFNAAEGARFRRQVLAFGSARDPKQILADYFGEDPDPAKFVNDF
jgi:Zn-dependent oligopeptidase